MLAGQAAADLDAEPQDVRAKRFAQLQIALFVGIKQDQRVHVAVARVEYVANLKAIFRRQLVDALQHVRQLGYRNGPIQTHVIVDLPHRSKGRFAAQPNLGAFLGRGALAQLNRVVGLGNRHDLVELLVDLRVRALDLHNQQRLAIGVACLGVVLDHLQHLAVHKLNGHGQHARLDDVGHAGARHLVAVKAHQHRPRAFWLAQDAQRGFGHHAHLTLGPADQPQQVIAARIQMRAADFHHRAVHLHHGHAHQVVRGHAVFQAMRPARIHRDVARDGAGQLRGRVGRIEEVVLLHRAGHAEVRAPGLHPDVAVVVIGLNHVIELGHAQDHAIRRGQRAARQRRARAARHHRHLHLVADFQHLGHLLGVRWQHRAERRAFVGGQGVALVGLGLEFVMDHRVFRQDPHQAVHQHGLLGHDLGVWCWHFHERIPSDCSNW